MSKEHQQEIQKLRYVEHAVELHELDVLPKHLIRDREMRRKRKKRLAKREPEERP